MLNKNLKQFMVKQSGILDYFNSAEGQSAGWGAQKLFGNGPEADTGLKGKALIDYANNISPDDTDEEMRKHLLVMYPELDISGYDELDIIESIIQAQRGYTVEQR